MNLTRRALFTTALAPVAASAGNFENLFKTKYVAVAYASDSSGCLYTLGQTVLNECLKEQKSEKYSWLDEYYKRSFLHRDYDTLACIARSGTAINSDRNLKATLVHEKGCKNLWYTIKLEDSSYKDPYGAYIIYLPVDICDKYKLEIYNESPIFV